MKVAVVVAALMLYVSALAQDTPHVHPPVALSSLAPTQTPKDTIPDRGLTPTITSVKSGLWVDPSVWSPERAPTATDTVLVKEDHIIDYTSANVFTLAISGMVRCDSKADSSLKAANILIYRTGKFICGTNTQPLFPKAEIVISNTPIASDDTGQFWTGLISFGEWRFHGMPKSTWHRLVANAKAGDVMLSLDAPPVGWKTGDKLILPDSRQTAVERKWGDVPDKPIDLQIEEVTVREVNGTLVTLNAPMKFNHFGAGVGLMPHVQNQTRNIIVRSESPTGTRGHTMCTDRALCDVRFVQFDNMGRTKAARLTTSNIKGRYPIHAHHYMGPRNASNTGFQGAFVGNSFYDSLKWAIAIHNSHWLQVNDNVIYKADGSGIQTEQGNERENEIDRNAMILIGKPSVHSQWPSYGGVVTGVWEDFGWEGSCLWFTGNDNFVRSNICANAQYAGVNINHRPPSGFGYHYPVVPRFRGADIAIDSEWEYYGWPTQPARIAPPSRDHSDNETYSSNHGYWVGASGNVGVIRNAKNWHIAQACLYSARNISATYDGYVCVNDPAISAQASDENHGLDFRSTTYESGKLTLRNIRIEGFVQGIALPGTRGAFPQGTEGYTSGVLEIIDGTLKNYVNVIDTSPNQPKSTTFRNIMFDRTVIRPAVRYLQGDILETPSTPQDFMGYLAYYDVNAHRILSSKVQSLNHNNSGQDFGYYFEEQAPNYLMYHSTNMGAGDISKANCPVASVTNRLTNQQCWNAVKVATLAEIAPCSTTGFTKGFWCSLGGTTPPVPPDPPKPPEDTTFAIGGRKYSVQDLGPDATSDSALRLQGVPYTVSPAP